MKTITNNIFEQTEKWMDLHKGADNIVSNKNGSVRSAEYLSPIEKFGSLANARGDYQLPDMDYYNSRIVSTKEIEELSNELSGSNK